MAGAKKRAKSRKTKSKKAMSARSLVQTRPTKEELKKATESGMRKFKVAIKKLSQR